MDFMQLSYGLLWVLVAVLAFVCLALIRQVGVLYERIAPVGALAINRSLKGGDKAPQHSLQDLSGHAVDIGVANLQGRSQLLFFLSPTCPVCKTLLPVLHSIQKHEKAWLDIVLASDGDTPEQHQRYSTSQALQDYPYVLSEALGKSFGVSKLPYAVLIDEQGLVVSLGIVNSREHLESLFEAKALGQSTIQDYLSGSQQQQDAEKSEPVVSIFQPKEHKL